MISETLLKTLAKAIDFEKIVAQLQSDPRVNEALQLAANIQHDFAEIKTRQIEIQAQLDSVLAVLESQFAKGAAKSKRALISPIETDKE